MGKTIVVILLCAVGVAFFIVALGYLCLSLKKNNPSRPCQIAEKTGFVQANGRNLYDGNGKLLVLKGVNFGNWFDQEFWMAVSAVGKFETGIYTPKRAVRAFAQNKNLTKEQIKELETLYIDEYIKECDFANVSVLGLNVVRINFTYLNVTTDGYQIDETAFKKLDWAIDMAEKYSLYVIIDYHGAVGSQNKDNHSGSDEDFDLYGNPKNREATIRLWEFIARRYCDRKAVAAYDLLNEPRSAPGKFAGKEQFDFYDELYQAIRKIDKNHLILMECFTFPTHGVSEKKYRWDNVAYSYHFYNQTFFSQAFALNFYKAMDNLMGYQVPIIVGEFNAWAKKKDWYTTFKFFEKLGWSELCWTYKANNYQYKDGVLLGKMRLWGVYELCQKPVDISTATYEEIRDTYQKVSTVHAEQSMIYYIYKDRQLKKKGD